MERKKTSTPALIWDLDGTLLDSYPVIVSAVLEAYREYGFEPDPETLYREIMATSLYSWIEKTEKATGIPYDPVLRRYLEINDRDKMRIPAMQHAAEVLRALKERGIPSFVFTHRGASTKPVLKNIGLLDFFDEVLSADDGFPRKPDPAAILYLVEKYGLDPDSTYYVGDRAIDMECAENAGIRGILCMPDISPVRATGRETHTVRDLLDIRSLF